VTTCLILLLMLTISFVIAKYWDWILILLFILAIAFGFVRLLDWMFPDFGAVVILFGLVVCPYLIKIMGGRRRF
jgi:hypothetical protein